MCNLGVYVLRPYNMFLSPIVEERINIDRTFSFQSSGLRVGTLTRHQLTILATEFLLGHGFDFEGPFRRGLPYLSRNEEATAIKNEKARLDRNAIADIHLRPDEVDALEFVRRTRGKILKWLKLPVSR